MVTPGCFIFGNYICAVDANDDGICDTTGSGSVIPSCGDGIINASEQCDDGNTINTDGCSYDATDHINGSCRLEGFIAACVEDAPADNNDDGMIDISDDLDGDGEIEGDNICDTA